MFSFNVGCLILQVLSINIVLWVISVNINLVVKNLFNNKLIVVVSSESVMMNILCLIKMFSVVNSFCVVVVIDVGYGGQDFGVIG